MSDNSIFFGGITFGTLIVTVVFIVTFAATGGDITDTEFLRFCMKNDIPLERCKISGPILDKSQEAVDGK